MLAYLQETALLAWLTLKSKISTVLYLSSRSCVGTRYDRNNGILVCHVISTTPALELLGSSIVFGRSVMVNRKGEYSRACMVEETLPPVVRVISPRQVLLQRWKQRWLILHNAALTAIAVFGVSTLWKKDYKCILQYIVV